jgi:hypothetical protein
MANGMMVGTRVAVRRFVMETWLVYRVNPVTGDIDTFELTCERGTFLSNYRLLGHTDESVFADVADRDVFDPMVDDWCKDKLDSWTEIVQLRVR